MTSYYRQQRVSAFLTGLAGAAALYVYTKVCASPECA